MSDLMVESVSLCARCAQQMLTCCQTREIYVTLGDVDRIAAKRQETDFVEYRIPEDPSYLDQQDDPAWQYYVLGAGGRRRVLKRRTDGDCVFLGAAGCELPLNVRPLVCRLYPYDYTEYGIVESLATGCPLELLGPGQTLTAELNMNITEARQWHAQLYREIRLERERPCELA